MLLLNSPIVVISRKNSSSCLSSVCRLYQSLYMSYFLLLTFIRLDCLESVSEQKCQIFIVCLTSDRIYILHAPYCRNLPYLVYCLEEVKLIILLTDVFPRPLYWLVEGTNSYWLDEWMARNTQNKGVRKQLEMAWKV